MTVSAFTGPDYSDAMRMAVKFFGGQRCGNTHNWMLYDNPNTTPLCHTGDKHSGNDMSGGWHDCGDHIKVATTMGYAAICLLSAYDIWPAAFEDHHDTAYKNPDKIPDVLNEAKVATDYFMKSLINGTTFVYYVGGSQDHVRWVTSSFQSTLTSDLGGEPRPTSATTDGGGAQVADYASALALMAMHYPEQAYAAKCRDAAIGFYAWAKEHQSNISIPEFYSSPNSEISDELSLAAILLYHLTKTESYKTDALGYLKNKWESNSALAWDTKADIAYYYIIKADPAANNGSGGTIKSFLKKNVAAGIKGVNNNYGIPWGWFKSDWGTNKLACGSAFAAALYAKLIEDAVITPDSLTAADVNKYNARIIDYMLGDNEFKHPFIHGYKGDMTFKVHHRNAMGRNDNPPTDEKNRATFLFASGALLGGPMAQGSFQNIIEGGDAFKETESGCDYNGPFIGALANLVSKLDPKQVSAVRNPIVKKHATEQLINNGTPITVIDIRGRTIGVNRALSPKSMTSGVYLLKGNDPRQSSFLKMVNIRP